ncbi:MAG: hypothetical protein Cons2KO_18900 [Congregibacter sp.]
MNNFENTVGFITGGAAGIGLGVAKALGEQGMTLVLADIEPQTLEATADDLRAQGIEVYTEVLDVADAEAYKAVAERTLARHKTIHFLFNNAGVAAPSTAGESTLEDWRWVVDVNLLAVAYGIEFFLPAMRASGEQGYIINTASMAGQMGMAGMGSYCATKFAVVGLSEALEQELADSPINVSVLCPAWVKTRIAESIRNHPNPSVSETIPDAAANIGKIIADEGISVDALVERVLRGMAENTFYLFTHGDFWPFLETRLQRIRDDYAKVLPAG